MQEVLDPEARLSAFDFELPPGFIATEPAEPRDSSKLLALSTSTGERRHRVFRDIPEFFKKGDVLVLNRTRVFPARLWAKKQTGGAVELLLLEGSAAGAWKVLARGAKGHKDEVLSLPEGQTATLLGKDADGAWDCRFSMTDLQGFLARNGETPLPPYILKAREGRSVRPEDPGRYQTVYAEEEGSVAAPTAGLHFTPELIEKLKAMGVRVEYVTLHIGWGTFKPVESEDLSQHQMLPERFFIPPAAVEAVRSAKGRVVGVGTSVTRSLETAAASGWTQLAGESSLFIRPGHRFKALTGLITNFHIPQSSPLILAAAFAGRERLLAAYREAIAKGYRFYSFGDAMFLGEF